MSRTMQSTPRQTNRAALSTTTGGIVTIVDTLMNYAPSIHQDALRHQTLPEASLCCTEVEPADVEAIAGRLRLLKSSELFIVVW